MCCFLPDNKWALNVGVEQALRECILLEKLILLAGVVASIRIILERKLVLLVVMGILQNSVGMAGRQKLVLTEDGFCTDDISCF